MMEVNVEDIEKQIKRLQELKTVKKAIENNNDSKGKTENQMVDAKKKLEEIDHKVDSLIQATIELLIQTKTLYEQYSADYTNRFTRE